MIKLSGLACIILSSINYLIATTFSVSNKSCHCHLIYHVDEVSKSTLCGCSQISDLARPGPASLLHHGQI